MRKMKRLVAVLVAAMMLASSFAGCGKSKENEPVAATTEKTEKKETVVEKKEPAEITLWADTKSESEFSKSQRQKFLDKHPDIKINVVDKSGDTNTEYAIAFAAGVAPDVISIAGPMFKKYTNMGFFAQLDEYINNWEEKDKHIDTFKDMGIKDGKTYGLVTFLAPMMFGYNKAMFKEAGLQPPKTWDEMINCAVKLTDRSKGRYGYSMLANDWLDWFFQFYVWQAGGDLTKANPDGTIELQFTSPEVIKAAELYRDLKWKHKVVQSDITLKFPDMVKEFATGKSAMMIFAPDWVPWVASMGMKTEDLGIMPMPVGPSGKPVTSTGVNLTAITGGKSKEVTDAAWEWVKFFIGREQLAEGYKDLEKKGVAVPTIMIYNDMKQSDIVKVDPEWEAAMNEGAIVGRDEYEGKSVLTKYIVAAVQKILVDKNADITAELKKQQEIAQKEAVEKYNADKKAGK